MKKLIRVVISCVLILSCFAGCGKEQSTTPTGFEKNFKIAVVQQVEHRLVFAPVTQFLAIGHLLLFLKNCFISAAHSSSSTPAVTCVFGCRAFGANAE